MGVRAPLPRGVAAGPLVLDEGRSLAELAAVEDRQDDHAAAAVVRGQDVLAGRLSTTRWQGPPPTVDWSVKGVRAPSPCRRQNAVTPPAGPALDASTSLTA